MMTMTMVVVIEFIIKSHVETIKKSPLKLLAKLLLESLFKSLVN